MIYIGVIGASTCSPEEAETARQVGREIARRGAVLICGGRGGVMEAAARGAREAGGIAIGILPGNNRKEGNCYLHIAIATGLGDARNAVIARTCDVLIAISGGYGTLSEIGLGLKMGKPVVGLNTWQLFKEDKCIEDIIIAHSPQEAVEKAITAVGKLNQGME
ncbi:TIGR00725 family protein [Calderihabitans maritimus]|uniref:TIGR00725 family protein n=1 Tax=Calderihabitans maritimus TaxID=1246530 RepID=A0A1Z5HVH9_9FIRM|nr:TIGR00725 family protein [Calderihabitans maritimus]GAW93335.1 hypothetical protein Daud_1584 [Calderihabitans maritimus]